MQNKSQNESQHETMNKSNGIKMTITQDLSKTISKNTDFKQPIYIHVQIEKKADLSNAYARFLYNGGIFVYHDTLSESDDHRLAFGQLCQLSLQLPNSQQAIRVPAQVVLRHYCRDEALSRQVLLAFTDENGRNMKQYIEHYLEQ